MELFINDSFGLPFMVFSGFFRSILAGEGDMKFPMMIAGLGTILNIILDPIFIFKLRTIRKYWSRSWDKRGCISYSFIPIYCFYNLYSHAFCKKHAYIEFNLKDFSPSKKNFVGYCKSGSSSISFHDDNGYGARCLQQDFSKLFT